MRGRNLVLGAVGLLGTVTLLVFGSSAAGTGSVQAQQSCLLTSTGSPSSQQLPYCLEIVKQTDPNGSNEEFPFHVNMAFDSGATYDFTLEDGEAYYIPVKPGIQAEITELVPAGWELDDIDCDGDFMFIDETDNSITIQVIFGPNETSPSIVCVFENVEEDNEDEGPRGNPGGIFGGVNTAQQNRERAAIIYPTPQPAPAPVVRPPSTGDGGLLP